MPNLQCKLKLSNNTKLMCGIIGYLGEDPSFDYLISSLKILQNRGYDTAGISTIN